jgi:hypothetical protein
MSKQDENLVPVQFTGDMLEAVDRWFGSTDRGCGLCLLCLETIKSEADFIADSNTHACDAGRRLEGVRHES